MTKIISINKDGLNEAIRIAIEYLKKGGVVVFPSDTVYGLLVDAKNKDAVSKLINFKNRAPGKAISVFVTGNQMIEKYGVIPEGKISLINSILPGPFTVVLDSKSRLDRRLATEKNTMGFRYTQFFPVQKLVETFNSPLTATSANLGGKSPHYSIESLLHQLPKFKQEMLDLIVDAGKLPRNKPSTVIDFTSEDISILRHGDVLINGTDEYLSSSPKETRSLAIFLTKKAVKESPDKSIVFLLRGDLGAGKTEFTRGVASVLGVAKIVSPTFVIYYEYDIADNQILGVLNRKKFIHADFYNISDLSEFEHLGLTDYLSKSVFMVCEWGEKLGNLYQVFSQKAHIYIVDISHISKSKRKINISKVGQI
jgi:L-threonylcarbamoyladenylate synthase